MAGRKPARGPLADPGQGHEPGLHLLVRERREAAEVEIAAGEADRVLGLAAREADRHELGRLCVSDPLPPREGVGVPDGLAEGGDQPVADGEGRSEGDLLRGDRGDERLEGVGCERRTQAAQALDEAGENRLRGGERCEAVEVEQAAEVAAYGLGERRLSGLDPDARLGRSDPHLDSVEDSMEAALAPEVGGIGPEGAGALGGELPVERLRQLDDYARACPSRLRTISWKSSKGANGTPRSSR